MCVCARDGLLLQQVWWLKTEKVVYIVELLWSARAGKVWLMKTFWLIEEQRRRCLREADLLKRFYYTVHACEQGFNYMLNEDERHLLAISNMSCRVSL